MSHIARALSTFALVVAGMPLACSSGSGGGNSPKNTGGVSTGGSDAGATGGSSAGGTTGGSSGIGGSAGASGSGGSAGATGGAGGAAGSGGTGGSSVPPGWLCDLAHYGTQDGCDCNCGVADPDCGADAAGLEAPSAVCPCEPIGQEYPPSMVCLKCDRCGTAPYCSCGSGSGGSGGGGSGGSGGTGGNPPVHEVNCASFPNQPQSTPYCQCSADSNPGTPDYNGSCGVNMDADAICCASASFPTSGSCACFPDQLSPGEAWYCHGAFEFCSCSYRTYPSTGYTALCDNVPSSTGVPWICCASPKYGQCDCWENVANQACAPGETQVSNCGTKPSSIQAPTAGCASGFVKKNTCTPDAGPKSCTQDSHCGTTVINGNQVCSPDCTSAGKCEWDCWYI